jgi:tetrapyrrole methylase family protein/MazG family protein
MRQLLRRNGGRDTDSVRNESITVVGLGPGDARLLTIEARELLSSADEVWLRTRRHPTVGALPTGPRYESFDAIYDAGKSFDAIYTTIVDRVLELGGRPEGVIYAVPGHPLFAEATVQQILARADTVSLEVRLVVGVSFIDTFAGALGLDPLADGLLLLDALTLVSGRRLLAPQRPTIIAQVYDRRTASHVKLSLLEAYPPDHRVSVVLAAGAARERVVHTNLAMLDRGDEFNHLATIYVPPLSRIADVRTFEGVRAIVAKLRDPDGGCPWDLKQTHESLKRFLLEEAYETIDALDDGDTMRLAEELGDLLMQIVLHAQLAEDAGEFVIEDVLASIGSKLVRRHPHVFGETSVQDADEVLRNWEVLKKVERGDAPLLDAVPKAMPALAQAQSVQSRAAKAGLGAILPAKSAALDIEELGDMLFRIVALAREREIDAEEALRLAVRRYRERVSAEERAAKQ